MVMMVDASTTAAVEHGLDVLPGVDKLLGSIDVVERQMSAPRVEVGCIRVMVARSGHAVEVEDELVRRQVQLTVGAPVTMNDDTLAVIMQCLIVCHLIHSCYNVDF